jgi:hypothetical protein
MAASRSTDTTETEVIVHRVRTKFHWPALQLNFWLLIMIVASATILGIFAYFMTVQTQLGLGTPWFVSLPVFSFLRLGDRVVYLQLR